MLRYSRTLPISQFFRYSAILIAILAVVLAGKGIGALQEAGMIPVTPLASVPRITMLGLFPTVEAVAAQLLALGAVAARLPRSRSKPAPGRRFRRIGTSDCLADSGWRLRLD